VEPYSTLFGFELVAEFQKISLKTKFLSKILLCSISTAIPVYSYCQIDVPVDTLKGANLRNTGLIPMQYDVADLFRDISHPNRKPTPVDKKSAITPMPNVAYGSTRNAIQLTTDFRKYWSLSKRNPERVLAFWNFGSYLISGALPYLELPGTGKDPSARSGRGYTIAYFKGLKYFDLEMEYRFPITKNKFLGGVAFFSMQNHR
jgi:hypothetical protein